MRMIHGAELSNPSITQANFKGPKHEKFVAGIFAQIRPVWTGELETRPKT
jgi:hypothetical protein